MSPANTTSSLAAEFVSLGLQRDMIVMVHSSLSRIGGTSGGPATVIAPLLEVLGPHFAESYFRGALTCP